MRVTLYYVLGCLLAAAGGYQYRTNQHPDIDIESFQLQIDVMDHGFEYIECLRLHSTVTDRDGFLKCTRDADNTLRSKLK